jgi:erythromycin esterase-like protein
MSKESAASVLSIPNIITKPFGLDLEAPEKARKAYREEEKQVALLEKDTEQFEKFKTQEANLLSTENQVITPLYRSKKSGNLSKQTEALAQIFNARKDEALQRRSAPGVSQTRMS